MVVHPLPMKTILMQFNLHRHGSLRWVASPGSEIYDKDRKRVLWGLHIYPWLDQGPTEGLVLILKSHEFRTYKVWREPDGSLGLSEGITPYWKAS